MTGYFFFARAALRLPVARPFAAFDLAAALGFRAGFLAAGFFTSVKKSARGVMVGARHRRPANTV